MRRVLVPLDLPPAMRVTVSPDAHVHVLSGETMGTTWSVRFVARRERNVNDVHAAIERALGIVVAQMSTWIADSDISRFNRAAAGTWHELPPEFHEVLQYGLTLAEDTSSAFDPSVGALVDLWGFGPKGPRALPSDEAVIDALRACRWPKLAGGRRAQQPGGVRLDLSGIAKGYAVDRVAEEVARFGFTDHLVEVGGELRGTGTKPDGSPWWVALESVGALPQTVVALHGLAIATSGDTIRYFEKDGRRYSHTIDPRTGYPIADRLASVTVLHRRCMCADALATALTVLGPDEGLAYAERQCLAARFAVRAGHGVEERHTQAFAAMLN